MRAAIYGRRGEQNPRVSSLARAGPQGYVCISTHTRANASRDLYRNACARKRGDAAQRLFGAFFLPDEPEGPLFNFEGRDYRARDAASYSEGDRER